MPKSLVVRINPTESGIPVVVLWDGDHARYHEPCDTMGAAIRLAKRIAMTTPGARYDGPDSWTDPDPHAAGAPSIPDTATLPAPTIAEIPGAMLANLLFRASLAGLDLAIRIGPAGLDFRALKDDPPAGDWTMIAVVRPAHPRVDPA